MLQNVVSHRYACVNLSTKGGLAPWRDMGYRSDSIALSRDMGPLRFYVRSNHRVRLGQEAQALRRNDNINDLLRISYCRVRNYYLIISKRALSCNFLR